MWIDIAFIIGTYLFGSLPVLHWIGKVNGFDLSNEDDLHAALWRKVGPAEGLAGVLWDIFKGLMPPLLARWLGLDIIVIGLCGLAAVIGQMWPIFHRFYGKERGNTTGIGAAFGIAPIAMGIAAIPIAIGALMRLFSAIRKRSTTIQKRLKFPGVSDSMPVGMFIGFLILPLVAWFLNQTPAIIWTFLALFFLIIFRRLTADLMQDIREDSNPNIASILKNRFLYDRSYR